MKTWDMYVTYFQISGWLPCGRECQLTLHNPYNYRISGNSCIAKR